MTRIILAPTTAYFTPTVCLSAAGIMKLSTLFVRWERRFSLLDSQLAWSNPSFHWARTLQKNRLSEKKAGNLCFGEEIASILVETLYVRYATSGWAAWPDFLDFRVPFGRGFTWLYVEGESGGPGRRGEDRPSPRCETVFPTG